MRIPGARYIHIHVPCPLGWGSAPEDTLKVARLAVESGLFPLFEAEHGEITARYALRRKVPVTEYLKLQRRFAHLFGKEPDTRTIAAIQAIADRNIRTFGLAARMKKPFAITLDPGSSLANHTGSWRTNRPGVRRPPAAVQPRLPGGRGHPGLALPRRGRRLSRARGRSW